MTPRSPIEQVRWRLAHTNPVTWDYDVVQVELRALSDLERGILIGPLWRDHFNPDHRLGTPLEPVLSTLEQSDVSGHFTAPLFDGLSADAALDALAAYLDVPPPKMVADQAKGMRWTATDAWMMRIGYCASMVCCRLVEEPGDVGRAALSKLAQKADFSSQIAKLIAARLTGEVEMERGIIQSILRPLDAVLAADEIGALMTAPVIRWADLLRPYGTGQLTVSDNVDSGFSADDLPAYRTFAETAVHFALDRVRAVQAGNTPYKADKLMSRDDAHAVARALKLGLTEGVSSNTPVLEEIWRGAAFAPDPKAKTLPSQTLTYQIGLAVIDEPRPDAVQLLTEIARDVRHASVKKRLSKYAKQAFVALGQRPERVLDELTKGALPAALSKFLKPGLEGLLLRDWDMDASVWATQMTDAALWPLASKLIWQIGDVTALPRHRKEALSWVTHSGSELPFDAHSRIRLWHPIEATEATRAVWRKALAEQAMQQPFAQAYRELYILPQSEMATQQTELFAGHIVAQIPMVGLARRAGFTLGFQDQIDLSVGGQTFRFFGGVRAYPGAGGEGTTGAIRLLGPAKTYAEVPQRVMNEAMRRFDLIISAGTAGTQDHLPAKHPDTFQTIWPGSQSIEMRRALLGFTRPEARVEGRWLLLSDRVRVHLGTGRLDRDGTPVDLPGKVKGKATARADDPTMDRIWAAIDAFGLKK